MSDTEIDFNFDLAKNLARFGFNLDVDQGRRLLVRLALDTCCGVYISHTEKLLLESSNIMTKKGSLNKLGCNFIRAQIKELC